MRDDVACRRLPLAVLVAVAAVGVLNYPAGAADLTRPNVILIVADDLGYGELGCYGQQRIKTPRIDQLAAEGVAFSQYYAGSAVCAPSRCVMMTGKHTGHAFVRNNREMTSADLPAIARDSEFFGQFPLADAEITLAELLRARGYATAAVGKWGLGMVGTPGDPRLQGFDSFYGYYCQVHAHNHFPNYLWHNDRQETLPGNTDPREGQTYSQDKFVQRALAYIREHRDEPFFLYLPFTIPHLSIQVPESSLAEYEGTLPESPYPHKGSYLEHRAPHAGYAAMISHLDRGVGRIVDLVDELGLGPNTLIIFTSDNGATFDRIGGADSDFFNSTARLRGRKGTLYEGGIRVPLVARWAGALEPGKTDAVCAAWDVLPTICEAAGAEPPEDVDGVSFLHLMTDRQPLPNREYLYWVFPGYDGHQALRSGDWKIVRDNLTKGQTAWQLYDLAADASEQHDLARQRPDVVKRLAHLAALAHAPSKAFPFSPPAE